jgi:hypothetical protein
MARVNVAKSVLLDPNTRAAYDLSRNRAYGTAAPSVQRRPPTRTGGWRFDYATAVMLAVVAPLVVGLLLYVATGAQVAAHPAPFVVW